MNKPILTIPYPEVLKMLLGLLVISGRLKLKGKHEVCISGDGSFEIYEATDRQYQKLDMPTDISYRPYAEVTDEELFGM